MLDWLRQLFGNGSAEPWQTLLVRMLAALLFGSLVVAIHRGTRSRSSDHAATFPATLLMLCVLIAMVTQVIGENFARAFSLVGVLSIVRFRTVVRDTKDTAFVIFAVVVGMSVGAGQPIVAVIGLGTVAVAAAIYRDRPLEVLALPRKHIFIVKLIWSPDLEAQIRESLSKHAADVQTIAASTIRQGSAMEIQYQVALLVSASLPQLISEMNHIEGVLSAELRSEDPAC